MGRQARDPAGSAHVPLRAGSPGRLRGPRRRGVHARRHGPGRDRPEGHCHHSTLTGREPSGRPRARRPGCCRQRPISLPGGIGTRAGHTHKAPGGSSTAAPKVDPERSYSPGLAPPPAHRSACHYWTALTAIPAEIADGRPGQRTDLQFLGHEPWLRPNARAEDSRRQTARGQADRPQRLPWPHHRPITLGADPALASLSVISPAPSLRAPTRRYAREPRAFGPPPMRCRTAVMWLEGRR
jgi:hypothetical protein